MANLISGRIECIYNAQTIPSKKGGEPMVKREFVIRALRFNPTDGTPELSQYNTPVLEFNGKDNVAVLDGFQVGDCVKVEFALEGRSVVNQDNTVKYFNTARAYRIEKLNIRFAQQTKEQGNGIPQAAKVVNTQQNGGYQQTEYLDEHGNPRPF